MVGKLRTHKSKLKGLGVFSLDNLCFRMIYLLALFKYIFNIVLPKMDQRCYVKPQALTPGRNRNYRKNSDYYKGHFNHLNCIKMECAISHTSESPLLTIFRNGWLTTRQGFIEVTHHSQLETMLSGHLVPGPHRGPFIRATVLSSFHHLPHCPPGEEAISLWAALGENLSALGFGDLSLDRKHRCSAFSHHGRRVGLQMPSSA